MVKIQTGIFILMVVVLSQSVFALTNPSYVYCNEMGYVYFIDDYGEGEIGYCKVSDDLVVGAWDFLQGKSAQEHSYCAKQGYEMKTVKDKAKCAIFGLEECAVCVVDDMGIEITNLMNLNFEETFCGDGNCGIPEDSHTCPEDCPKGGFDYYCDGGDDPDCEKPLTEEEIIEESSLVGAAEEEEIQGSSLPIILTIIGAVIVMAIAAFFFMKKKVRRN